MTSSSQELLNRGLALHTAGRLSDAQVMYLQLLRIDPGNPLAMQYMGVLKMQRGDFPAAVALLQQAVMLDPANFGCHANLGNALRGSGDFQAALSCFDQAVKLAPDNPNVHNARGQALLDLGRIAEALAEFRDAIQLQPGDSRMHVNAGCALLSLERYADALQHFDRAIALTPADPSPYSNRAAALLGLNRSAEALASAQQALARDQTHLDAMYNAGCALLDLTRAGESRPYFEKVLARESGYLKAEFNLGIALRLLREYEYSAERFRHVLSQDRNYRGALGALVRSLRSACRWDDIQALEAELLERVSRGERAGDAQELIAICDSPEILFRSATVDAQRFVRSQPATGPVVRSTARPAKLVVGYLSADFHEHATSHLMAELFEEHDRSRFEIVAFSYGPDDGSLMRQRLTRAFDQFTDITSLSDESAAELMRQRGVHIAVDLKGLTHEGRLGILAGRCAPVQVTYLGYPGTTGCSFIDYVLADRVVIPEGDQRWYSEKVVYLPDTYQVNDRRRAVATESISRTEHGLPQDAFVYCCFCASFKITPVVFASWMRLLAATPHGVLWLLDDNEDARRNLRAQTMKHGIAPERVIFAPRIPTAHHIARYRAADLFLDTLPYGAHTTASEALWAGLPVLTCRGQTFSGRVAASLLLAAGLPELVTDDLTQYESLAKSLANSPKLLRSLRDRLESGRQDCALFDTGRFRKNLECAYDMMWNRYVDGE